MQRPLFQRPLFLVQRPLFPTGSRWRTLVRCAPGVPGTRMCPSPTTRESVCLRERAREWGGGGGERPLSPDRGQGSAVSYLTNVAIPTKNPLAFLIMRTAMVGYACQVLQDITMPRKFDAWLHLLWKLTSNPDCIPTQPGRRASPSFSAVRVQSYRALASRITTRTFQAARKASCTRRRGPKLTDGCHTPRLST